MQKYMSYKEAASEIGISYSLVRKYVAEGRLGTKLPGRIGYLISKEDVKAFKKIPRKVGKRARKVLA